MNFPSVPSGFPIGAENGSSNGHHTNPTTPSSPPTFGEPSKARREHLKKYERPPIELSNMTPIPRYYTAADKVLHQFKAHLKNQELDDAYIIGRRFALFSTVSLPKHDYYKSPNSEFAKLRLQNQKDAQWVTRGLERIVEVMDKQEVQRVREEEERIRMQKEAEEKQKLEWEKSMRQRLNAVESSSTTTTTTSGSSSSNLLDWKVGALGMSAKLEKLNALFPKDGEVAAPESGIVPSAPPASAPPIIDDNISPLPPPMAPPPTMGMQDLALFNSTAATQHLKSDGGTPLFGEPVAPPNYSDLFLDTLRTTSSSSAVGGPHVSPEELAELERLPSYTTTSPTTAPKPKLPPRTPIRIIQQNCLRQMQSLQNSNHIEIQRLGTFQGRLGASNPRFDSTNGCAVISPLVVATHIYPQHAKHSLSASSNSSKYGISNSAITEIIDKRAPPILQAVRAKEMVGRHALLVPSAVHDYLVDEHILPQDKFVGVCGGDIMDQTHINELVTMLVDGNEDQRNNNGNSSKKGILKNKTCRKKRVGAVLYFREHVISIVKIPLGNGVCYYDLIDSLPSSSTGGMSSRTRCKDLASFEVLLRWYASSKFSESNCDFIDDNVWDEGMADFDPRVFQGFAWSE